jgi:hypothetical protein
MMRSAASTAALLLACVAALVGLAGCSHDDSSPTGLRLQREDLALAAHELRRVEPAAARELAAAKAVWPRLAHGLPAETGSVAAPVRAAQAAAAALPMPSVFSEPSAVEFTGPGYSLVALYRSFQSLTAHAWPMISAAIDQIERGSPAARFARENVGIYIESVYDAHFGLAQVGKKLVDGYHKLKGPAAFGATLTQAEVNALAAAYSEANYRLQPHVDAKLGS